jgi:hypothetical protein
MVTDNSAAPVLAKDNASAHLGVAGAIELIADRSAPSVQGARNGARTDGCRRNIKGIGKVRWAV